MGYVKIGRLLFMCYMQIILLNASLGYLTNG